MASRTVALGLAVLFALGSLTACGEADRAMSHIDESRLATPEHPVTSPSGRYRLGVVTGEYCGAEGTGEFWRIQIRDRDGKLVLDSPRRFSTRFRTSILWDDHDDRAWVDSSDIGTYYTDRDSRGEWRLSSLGLEGIATARPPVPQALADAHPAEYGPEARAKARRLVREQEVSPGDDYPEVADDDPRLNLPPARPCDAG